MKLYIALLALAANSVQVLGAPAEDTQDIAVFDTMPSDKTVNSAESADDDTVIAEACAWCPSPCGNYYCCDGPTPYCGYLTNPFECICWGPV